MELAPIILFTYNRLDHTKEVLNSLIKNNLAKDSIIYIYCDGIKANATNKDKAKNKKLVEFLEDFKSRCKDFNKINLSIKDKNMGLADSIINGVSEVITIHKKAIVLEDDIVVSPVFLDYMNESLNQYENETKIWSINGWSYPIDSNDLDDCYFWRIPHCWGWATWENRWKLYKRDIKWVKENFNKFDIEEINLKNYANYFGDFILNEKGKIKTWAIFNYLLCYKHNALNLAPKISYIKQIGFDGSGVHCSNEDIYNAKNINTKFPIQFPKYIEESKIALTRIQNFHQNLKKPIHIKIKNKIIKIMGGGNLDSNNSNKFSHSTYKAA